MHLLLLVHSAAFAQNPPSLADDPNHDAYVQAVLDLDLPLAIEERPIFQIMPGTLGVIKAGGIRKIGQLMALKDLFSDTNFVESMAYVSNDVIATINTEPLVTIEYTGKLLGSDLEASMNTKLHDWDIQDDPSDLYMSAVDGNGSVAGPKFLVSNNSYPNDGDIGNPGLLTITPLGNDCIDLYGFELKQTVNGSLAVVGWLLRERRDYGNAGVDWVDHWFYRTTFKSVASAATKLTIVPATNLSSPDSLPQFLQAIKTIAPVGAPGGLNRRQVAVYSFDELEVQVDLLP